MSPPVFQLRGRGNTRLVQQEDFTVCIRNNVREYGGGDICLKEHLTNADDAKATRFIVCLDKAQYSSQGLLGCGMKAVQGPALIIGNDAEFSQADWNNYTRKVGDSSKVNDPDTAGKFGKGALTAYSLSDVIQLVSGNQLLVLDPHGIHLPDSLLSWGCELVNRDNQHFVDLSVEAPGQLEPFIAISKSNNALPQWDGKSCFAGTLFRLAMRTEAAAAASQISDDVISTSKFMQILEEFMTAAPDLLLFLRHVREISVYVKEAGQQSAILKHQSIAKLVSTGASQEQRLAVNIKHADGHLTSKQWLKIVNPARNGDGIAALLKDEHCKGNQLPSLAGKVYSTMALPLDNTGLPVHINGAFFVSSDRRNLWEGEGDGGKGAKNRAVLADNIAPAWARAITRMCKDAPADQAFDTYKLWPSARFQPALLEAAAVATAACLVRGKSKVLWVPRHDSDSEAAGGWFSPQEVCLLPPPAAGVSPLIINVGLRAGLKITDAPQNVTKILEDAAGHASMLTSLTPAVLRKALRAAGNIIKPSEAQVVLQYVIGDVIRPPLLGADCLAGLHLILLADNSVQKFAWYGTKPVSPADAAQKSVKRFFLSGDGDSQHIYDLMSASVDQQVKPSLPWSSLSGLKVNGVPLLESKVLNVQLPSFDDLADSLPSTWKGSVCTVTQNSAQHPNQAWLDKFWGLVTNTWHNVPDELMHVMVVPLTGNRLASPAFCRSQAALSTAHLRALPANTAGLLSALGCLCIADARADRVSCISPTEVPVIAALAALPSHMPLPLHQLVSPRCLDDKKFEAVRSLLANHIPLPQEPNDAVWDVLKQCCIFETADGDMTDLRHGTLQLLPNAEWEQQMLATPHLVQWEPVKYHTASNTQQTLLKHSGLVVPQLPHFLDNCLLDSIQISGDSQAETLLLQALDQLGAFTIFTPRRPNHLLVNDRVSPVYLLVDSSSKLLQALFEGGARGYTLLPAQFATEQRLTVLKSSLLRLKHEDSETPDFFLACAKQFVKLAPDMSRDDKTRHSISLVNMLQRNISKYHSMASALSWDWDAIKTYLADCPIFLTAELGFPYDMGPKQQLVSLRNSTDHAHYRVMANAVAVINNAMGPTSLLRSKLELPTEPRLELLVQHLLKTVKADSVAALFAMPRSKAGNVLEILIDDTDRAYGHIVEGMDRLLAARDTKQLILANRLYLDPWVLVDSGNFVVPSELCFGATENSSQGLPVPAMLAKHLQGKPAVKQWMVKSLGATDPQSGAPSIRQHHSNPVTATTTIADQFRGLFNNSAKFPDAVVVAAGREILVHKLIIAKACTALANHWNDTVWKDSGARATLDGSCPECSIEETSYNTAVMFLEFFYTGLLRWPDNLADSMTAAELLVLANKYQVPYLVCEAERALRSAVTIESCCDILTLADWHHAQQLKQYCLAYIAGGNEHIQTDGLSDALKADLKRAIQSRG